MRSALNLYIYLAGGSSTNAVLTNYGPLIEDIKFSTIAPGGFGDMHATLRVPQSRIIPPEIKIFANVALLDGFNQIFLGRLDEPNTGLDKQAGDTITLTALGASHILKDDPQDSAYTAQTCLQVITDQLQGATLGRSNYLPIDPDLSQVLPDNPGALYSPSFQGKNIEEILNELTNDLGDYQWAVWGHPRHKDLYGFPTWQLYWHARNFQAPATPIPTYIATLASQISHDIKASVEYSYSAVTILSRDQTTSQHQQVTVQDSRLNANKSQGTAPIPFRRLRKDVSEALLTTTQALAIANALLAQYKNGGFKVTLDIASVTDPTGNPIPLHLVRADSTILIPDLAPLGQKLPGTYVQNTNLFYITETQYAQVNGQTPKLTLTCDSYYDTTAFQLAKMQRIHEHRTRNRKNHGAIQASGESEIGKVGGGFPTTATTADTFEFGTNFKMSMASAPSSITLTANSTLNVNTPTVADITTTGFELLIRPTANGQGYWRGSYRTNGN